MIKLKKILNIILFLMLFISCGIEDTVYLKEPTNINVVVDDIDKTPVVKFYGFNQEKPDGYYIFVGYDLFYYFTTPEKAKRAVVFNPYQRESQLVTSGYNSNLLTTADIKGTRQIYQLFTENSYFYEIYKKITFPVTESMIEDVLYEANLGNVSFSFHDVSSNNEDYLNPFQDIAENTIFIDKIYPSLDDYPEVYDSDFEGFFDPDLYEKLLTSGVAPTSTTGDYTVYKCYFYIVAKGFENSIKTSFTSLISSVNSSTFSVDFYVKDKN